MPNRSAPPCAVVPVLYYPDPGAAAGWLCAAFGFVIRLRIANHRIQMWTGERPAAGCLIVAEGDAPAQKSHVTMVRVPDARAHCEHARSQGAIILEEPIDYFYGECQYRASDFAGHLWTFTQTIADIEPESWGGESVNI